MTDETKSPAPIDVAKAIRVAMRDYAIKYPEDSVFDRASGFPVMKAKFLAEAMGCTRAYVSYIRIHGINRIDGVEKIAAVFNMGLIEFLQLGDIDEDV